MVNNEEIIFHKTKYKQVGGRKHDYKIYKKNHSDTLKDVGRILDLGFLGMKEKDYPEQISLLSIKKKKENQDLILRSNPRGKRVQQNSF